MLEMTPEYNTLRFCEIFEKVEDFMESYEEVQFPKMITEDNARTLYYLLYSKYGNNPISNLDVNQFKYKLFATVWQYGPTWQKRLDIQEKLRNIPDEELLRGGKAIYNHAFNPSSAPSTDTLEEIETINDQNTTNYKKSKMEAYMQLWELLKTDVTSDFLNKFSHLFKKFVANENPLLYITEEE